MGTKKQNGGARPGAGRKPTVADAPAVATVSFRLSERQKEKLLQLGGASWIRDRIDDAKEQTPKE